jgi:hypothetical protein
MDLSEMMMMIDDTIENYKRVMYNTLEAKAKYRKSDDIVRLMVVTKTVPPERVNSVIRLGADLLGENRVQEYLEKKDSYEKAEVHFIGHLQTNKVKYIIDSVKMIHSVDSIKLAYEIDRLAEKNKITADILAEINIGNEESKSGVLADETGELIAEIKELKNVRLRGLMTIPPPNDPEKYFEKMQMLFEELKGKKGGENMDTLSMGMSADYEKAIKYGSNIVRIGSAIFGARK